MYGRHDPLLRYEATRRMATLQDVLVSRAAAKQRRGRAGRMQPGLCVHLFPSDTDLAAYTEPEVRRTALEQVRPVGPEALYASLCDSVAWFY